MTRTTDETARELTDRAAIQDVLLRYARGVDRKDLDLVASCFTPDASYEGALAHGTVADALARLRDRMARYDSTMHFIGNQLIEINGDAARSETYAIAYHRLTENGEAKLFTVGVRYLDELTRGGDVWRIRRAWSTWNGSARKRCRQGRAPCSPAARQRAPAQAGANALTSDP